MHSNSANALSQIDQTIDSISNLVYYITQSKLAGINSHTNNDGSSILTL